jgi:hypothetical protein
MVGNKQPSEHLILSTRGGKRMTELCTLYALHNKGSTLAVPSHHVCLAWLSEYRSPGATFWSLCIAYLSTFDTKSTLPGRSKLWLCSDPCSNMTVVQQESTC